MSRFDEILREQIQEIETIAKDVIALERRGPTDDDDGAEFFADRVSLRDHFEETMSVLKALLFDPVSEARGEYEKRRAAYVEYRAKTFFQSAPAGTFRLGDLAQDGPAHGFGGAQEYFEAAEARDEKIREG